MPDEQEQILSQRIRETIARNLEKSKAASRKSQSTYNQKVADEFKKYYDKAIETLEPVCIPWLEYWQYAPDTLYKQVNGGLKWLCCNGEVADMQRYMRLRAAVKFKKSYDPNEGIWISFNTDKSYLKSPVMQLNQPIMDRTQWKATFFEWFENGTEAVLSLNGLNLSQDDKEFVENYISDVNKNLDANAKIVYQITLDSLRIHR